MKGAPLVWRYLLVEGRTAPCDGGGERRWALTVQGSWKAGLSGAR